MSKVVGIAEFKAKCERLLSRMEQDGEPIEPTRHGKVIGVLSPPPRTEEPIVTAFGMSRNEQYRFDDPFAPAADPHEWEANNPAELYRQP